MNTRHFARIASASLLGSASFLSIVTAAQAQQVVFSSTPQIPVGTIAAGREFAVTGSTVQIRLASGAVASFVGNAQFSIRPDGAVDLRAGSVTIVANGTGEALVHMPEGVRGTVARGGTGSFTANASGARGSTAAGIVTVVGNGTARTFGMGQFWAAPIGQGPDRVIAGEAAAVPGTDTGPVKPLRAGGIVAAAENGIPIALGEGLAAVGARGDIVAAARRLEAYDRNPTIDAFPGGDYALLVGYAAQATRPFGADASGAGSSGTGSAGDGLAFRGAGADIIRTYFEYLAAGNGGPNFRTAYAGILLNYLDLVRSGVLPSSFRGATQSQLNAYIAFIGRTDGFGSLSVGNRQLLDAYLAFLTTGGQPDAFGASVTSLTTAFLNYVRGGGNPATFSQASASVVAQYLSIVSSGGLRTNLTAQNQALLAAYLANNGIAFTTTYATGLAAFVAYLNTGGLPSGYTALSTTTIRSYLETLETTGLFDSVLGTQAAFLRSYLAFLRTGGTPDQFNALPINVARVNASALNIYVDYLLAGGLPSTYTTLTAAQIRAALDQLTATGQFNALLGANAAFLGEYFAYLKTGADADTFAGLPSVDVNAYASALALFASYLRAGNLPSSYTTLSAQQIRNYLTALQVGGKLSLLGSDATLLGDYLVYLRTGGVPDQFAGLPIVTYQGYASALSLHFAYLNGGGLPSGYTALSQAQLRAYLDALKANGQFGLLGANAAFYTDYLAFLAGGGSADAYAALPIVTYQGYATALTAYFAYLNAGGLPSGYTALTQAQVRAYLDALRTSNQLTALLGANASFYTAYLTYLAGGGAPDQFSGLPIVTYQGYATSLAAYYAFLLNGGTPTAYTALTQAQIRQYLDVLKASGQLTALLGANAAFFDNYLAYLAGGGGANAYPGLPSSTYGQYASALSAYFAYLNAGGLPSGYTALTAAQIRQYLDVLKANNQLAALLGGNASFFDAYLTFLSGGGAADAFTGLPIVTYRSYASSLTAYYAYLAGGGLPASYTLLTQAQIRQYLDALQASGQLTALLGSNATFFTSYLTYLAGGGSAGEFPGLPATTYASYGTSIATFVAFLRGNGLPGSYTALTATQLREYLAVLVANGQLARIGSQADIDLVNAYAAFLATGGVPNQFAGLPAFVTYESALRTYYAFIQGGGRPSAYTALTQAQIVAYIQALDAAGLVATKLTAAEAAFLRSYATFVAGGGNADQFAGLPINQGPTVPVVTQGLASAPRGTGTVAYAAAGKAIAPAGVVNGNVVLTGNAVSAFSGSGGATIQTAQTVEARTVDTSIAIARISGGTYNNQTSTVTLGANEGLHLVWGTPATAVPTTGTLTYGLVTATAPTVDGGAVAPGTFAGNLALDLANRRIGWDTVIGMGGVTYRFASTGGTTTPSQSLTANFTTNTASSTASNGLAGSAQLFLSGTGGAYAGFAYQATAPIGIVTGAAIFGKGQATTTLPAVTYTGAPTTPVITQGLATAPTSPIVGGAVGKAFIAAVNTQGQGSVTVSGNNLTAYNGASIATAVETTSIEARTVDSTIALARWAPGTWRAETGGVRIILANEGLHFVWGAPATALPTIGIATFGLVTATSPTVEGGTLAPGSFAGTLGVDFANRRVGLDSRITIGGVVYGFATPGGSAAPSSTLALGATGTFNGTASTTNFANSSGGLINGFLSGAGGAYAGLIYSALLPVGTVDGSAIFGQNQAAAILPTITYTGTPTITPSLPAASYAYAGGLAANSLTVRSTYPTATASGLTLQAGAGVTRDSAGALVSSINASTQDLTRLTAKATDTFGDNRAVIGRWFDGTYRRGVTSNAADTLGTTQSLHYLQMAPTSFVVPTTGQINYALLAATQPTYNTGATGAGLFDGRMALAFGSSVKVALEGTIRMPEPSGTVTYAFATPGGVAGVAALAGQTFSNNVIAVTAPLTGAGLACTTACQLNFTGGFAGADALRLGAVYFTSDARANAPSIEGAAIFTGTAFDPNSVIVPTPTRAAFTYAGGFGSTNHGYLIGDSDATPATFNASGGSVILSDTVDASGGVTTFGGGSIGTYSRGTSRQADQAGDNIVLIGRWYGGVLTAGGNVSRTMDANDSLHYALIAPATLTLPTTGTIQYGLIGATQPTMYGGGTTTAAGQVGWGYFDAKMGITFGAAPKVGIEGALYMPETTAGSTKYSFTTVGGAATPGFAIANLGRFQNGVIDMDTALTGSGLACPAGATGCKILFTGEMGGAGASRVGVTYTTTNTTNVNTISGAAAFAAAGTIPGTGGTVTMPTQPTYAYTGGFTTAATGRVRLESDASAQNSSYAQQSGTLQTTVAANGTVSMISGLEIGNNARGTATNYDVAGDATILLGRWSNGTVTAQTTPREFGANDGFHYFIAAPGPRALPTSGTVQYTLLGATQPTMRGSTAVAPGVFDARFALTFGSNPRLGMDGTIHMAEPGGAVRYSFTTPGGAAAPGQNASGVLTTSGIFFQTAMTGTGLACPTGGTCQIYFDGLFAGTTTNRVGFTYSTLSTVASAASLHGAAIFGAAAAPAAPVTVQNQRIVGLGDAGSLDARAFSQTGPVTFDAAGKLTAFGTGSTINTSAADITVTDSGRVADVVGWSRWTNGTTTTAGFGPYGANQSLHLMAGTATTSLPTTGTVGYTMIGGTKPTLTDGSAAAGTLTGSMAVAFGSLPKVGLDLRMTVGSLGWTVVTAGGVTNPSASSLNVTGSGVFGGGLNATSTTSASCQTQQCFATVAGQFYGSGASHAGVNVSVQYDRPNGQLGNANGLIVFAKQP